MQEQTVIHSTFVIERSYPVAPERVFDAFADPVKKRRWFGRGEEIETEVNEADFRVGGTERRQFLGKAGTPVAGLPITNNTTYQDIVTNRRIVMAYTMSVGDHRISASLATVELLQTDKGTDLIFTEQSAFFEGADGPERREDGWRKLLESLGKEF